MQEQQDITQMSVEELKAIAYDKMMLLNRVQSDIGVIQRQLVEKSSTPKKKIKKELADVTKK